MAGGALETQNLQERSGETCVSAVILFAVYALSTLSAFYAFLGSVLAQFLPRFPSQIWVSDVTLVTFFGDKKCDALHLSHFWEECDALAHDNLFLTVNVFCHILPEKRHILAPPVQIFLNGKKCENSAGTGLCCSLPISDLSLISEA